MVNIEERFIKLQLEESPESEKFLRHLIKRKIITIETMRNYLIVKQMDEYIKGNKGHIGHAHIDLSDDFNISERTIRRIIKQNTRIF